MVLPPGKSGKFYASPWLVIGSTAILAIVVVVLAVINVNREKRYMSQILSEKGAALAASFEAGIRAGMVGTLNGKHQIQTLLEETARQPGISYLAITDGKGQILAHSNRERIGGRLFRQETMQALSPAIEPQWRISKDSKGGSTFELYRQFKPFSHGNLPPCDWRDQTSYKPGTGQDRCRPLLAGVDFTRQNPVIFVGMDAKPFEEAWRADLNLMILIVGVLLLLGFGGVLSLYWSQSYRHSRRQLQDTRAMASKVIGNLPVGLIVTGPDNRIVMLNSCAERITGTSQAEVLGRKVEEEWPHGLGNLAFRVGQGESISEEETEIVRKDNQPIPLSLTGTRVTADEGNFVGNIFILRDLVEIRRLQAEVRRKEKLAAVGNLAAGVAHEIRNPLSSIKGFATYLSGKFPQDSEERKAAVIMIQEVDRLNRVISELMELARPTDLKISSVDISVLIKRSLSLVRQDAAEKDIRIKYSVSNNLPKAAWDPDRIIQALLNLYLNALQSTSEMGEVTVNVDAIGADSIRIQVTDTGEGIAPQDIGKVFNPYFTTKQKGTGLGLAIVNKIVEAHGGTIRVDSVPGRGSVFTVILPVFIETKEDLHGATHSHRR